MVTEYRPDVLGKAEKQAERVDPRVAIAKMEDELSEMARSLRQFRQDYVAGMITDTEFKKIESRFMDMLAEQRNILQLLRKAANHEL
jgi:hypothetical protein